MAPGTVLVLPGGTPATRSALDATVRRGGWPVHHVEAAPGPPEAWSARVCAGIAQIGPDGPLVIAAEGEAALLVPAVARAQRAAHRLVAEYLLVDPTMPTVTDSWPDAPVTVVSDDPNTRTVARLRGWTVLAVGDDWVRLD